MRLIDADKLIVALKRKSPINDAMRVMLDECISEVDHAPTIMSGRKKGNWIHRKNWDKYVCSECGFEFSEPYTLCPNCGADMRSEKE